MDKEYSFSDKRGYDEFYEQEQGNAQTVVDCQTYVIQWKKGQK